MVTIKVFQLAFILAIALVLQKCSSPAMQHLRAEDARRTEHVNNYFDDHDSKSHNTGTATSPAMGGKEARHVE